MIPRDRGSAWVVVAVTLAAGCSGPPTHPDPFLGMRANCGEVSYFYASEGLLVDDSSEYCGGVMGTFYTDYADNSAIGDSLFFDAWNRDDDIYYLGPILTFEVDVSQMVEGAEVEATSGGIAFWLDELANVRDPAPVTSGWVRVEAFETDGTFDEPYGLIEWDVVWGDPSGSGAWYTASGHDWVWLTTG